MARMSHEIEAELHRLEEQIETLIRANGFVEDLIQLEQRRKALVGELATQLSRQRRKAVFAR